MTHYMAVFVPERGGGWSVLFPDLPGCATQGEDFGEAIGMAVDALAGHTAVMRDFGDPLPEPSTLEEIRKNKAWCEEHGVEWGKAVVAPIAVRGPIGKPERVTVSLDSNVLRQIDAYANRNGLTRSSVLTAGAEVLLGQDITQVVRAIGEEARPRRKKA